MVGLPKILGENGLCAFCDAFWAILRGRSLHFLGLTKEKRCPGRGIRYNPWKEGKHFY